MKLTDRTVRATLVMAREMGDAQWKHEPRGRGRGALSLKAMPGGRAHWYFRYSLDRRHQYVAIGTYGTAADEFTLEAARERCDDMAAMRDRLPGGDLRAHLEAQDAVAKVEQRKVAAAAVVAERGTLAALMGAYADGLDARGKVSTAKDVRGLVRLHVTEQFSEYAAAPAKALTARQAAEMLRKIVEAGKGRTAAKVRAYLRAAYGQAQRAESDPAMPSAMLAFGVEVNPIVGVATMPQFNVAANRALSEAELRALWKRLAATDTPSAVVLRLSILLGGQRFNQLLRARVTDIDAGTLTLFDPKGRRATPRRHVLPCPAPALALLKRRAEIAAALESDLLFPSGSGEPVSTNTVSKFLQDVRKAMLAAKEARSDFELKDLRRTCETHLAALGVSKDVRAQIQSHGLGGVQDRHYDRHDYLVEKQRALDGWAQWLTSTPTSKIQRIREGVAA